eukprot:scaffold273730_cov21-Tisochrysis_lutea.AAC.1
MNPIGLAGDSLFVVAAISHRPTLIIQLAAHGCRASAICAPFCLSRMNVCHGPWRNECNTSHQECSPVWLMESSWLFHSPAIAPCINCISILLPRKTLLCHGHHQVTTVLPYFARWVARWPT